MCGDGQGWDKLCLREADQRLNQELDVSHSWSKEVEHSVQDLDMTMHLQDLIIAHPRAWLCCCMWTVTTVSLCAQLSDGDKYTLGGWQLWYWCRNCSLSYKTEKLQRIYTIIRCAEFLDSQNLQSSNRHLFMNLVTHLHASTARQSTLNNLLQHSSIR